MEVAGCALSQEGLGSVEASRVALRLVIWNELVLLSLLSSLLFSLSFAVEAKSWMEESSCANVVRSSSRRDVVEEEDVCVTVTVDFLLVNDDVVVFRRDDGTRRMF